MATKSASAVDKRPERPEWLDRGIDRLSETVVKNVLAIIDAEKRLYGDDGLTRLELGRLMGLSKCQVYNILRMRNQIGTTNIIRFSHVLGIPPHSLQLPHAEFKREIVPQYQRKKRSRSRSGAR